MTNMTTDRHVPFVAPNEETLPDGDDLTPLGRAVQFEVSAARCAS